MWNENHFMRFSNHQSSLKNFNTRNSYRCLRNLLYEKGKPLRQDHAQKWSTPTENAKPLLETLAKAVDMGHLWLKYEALFGQYVDLALFGQYMDLVWVLLSISNPYLALSSFSYKSSLIPIPHDLWTLTMGVLHISQCSMQFPCHLGTLVYDVKMLWDLGKFHTIPISSRHASQCDMGMIWSTSIKPPYYHPGISVSDIWMIWLVVHAIY